MDKKEKLEPVNRDEEISKSCEETNKTNKKTLIANGFLNDKWIDTLLFAFGLCMALVHMIYANYIFISLEVYRTMHLCFGLAIGTLFIMKKSSSRVVRIVNFALIGAVAFSFVYISINVDELRMRQWMNTDLDLIVGILLIALAFYTSIKHFGWILPIITFCVVVYPMFGKYIPGVFRTTNYTIEQMIVNLSIGLHGGVYNLMSVSANFIFLFSVFGGAMNAVGVTQLFGEVGKLAAGRARSGSAQSTSIMNALFGTVIANGMAVAEITGPITVPAMLKRGYKNTVAGGILASAANGGKILPPVMGALAFAVAGFANIPYWTIAKMSTIPALLYYAGIMWYAHVEAMKDPVMRIKITERPKVDWSIIKWKAHIFVIPFTLVVYMMAIGRPMPITAFYGIAVTLAVSFITKKEYRPKWRTILKEISSGALMGGKLACCLALVGMLITTFDNSGLNVKLAGAIEALSHGSLFIVVLVIILISIVAGMAGEVISAYLVIATFGITVLKKLGVSYEMAHFFCSFPSNMAVLTPPVAILSLVTAKIAGAPYGKTALESCKCSFVGFAIPFILCYAPAISLMGSSGVWMWIDIAIVTVLLFALQTSFSGWLIEDMGIVSRSALGMGGLVLYIYIVNRYLPILGIGLALILISFIIQVIKHKKVGQTQLTA